MLPLGRRFPKILAILEKDHPDPASFLHFGNPLQLLAATILSAQCTDEQVNKVTPALFRKYPTAADFARADPTELEGDIHSTGFFRNKTRSLIGAARRIEEAYGGRVPDSMEDLITLPGVARKTANIVLSQAFRKAEGIAVDVHVARVSRRLGLSDQTDPVKIERDLLKIVPRRAWIDFNYLLVSHGRKVCKARKPDCAGCRLLALCPRLGVEGAPSASR